MTEHEKLAAVKEKSQAIGEFIEWLRYEKGLRLAEYTHRTYFDHHGDERTLSEELFTVDVNMQELLAEFFEIDLDKLEEEKLQMLKEIRKRNR